MNICESFDKLTDIMLGELEKMGAVNNIAYFLEEVMEYQPLINSKIQSKVAFLKESLEDKCLTEEQYNEEIQHINNFTKEIGSIVDSLSGDMSVGKGNVIPTVDTELWLGRIKAFVGS